MRRRDLSAGWRLSDARGPVPTPVAEAIADGGVSATVPGCVHVDLLDANLIPDPYFGENEAQVAWIGHVDWTYTCRFAWNADGEVRHDLVFDGVDTVAAIELNGVVLGEVANQHRRYRFDVAALLRDGENDLVVRFRAPLREIAARSLGLGARPRPYPLPYEALRKSAANFGWDWGIATFTTGMWRAVRLESWSTARLGGVRVVATPDGAAGTVAVDARVDAAQSEGAATHAANVVRVTVSGPSLAEPVVAEAPIAADGMAHVEVALASAERWWPVGHGAQPLYDVEVELISDGASIDAARRDVGFRDIRWDTEADADGAPFTLVVNDRPIFVKGVNWIPDDALPARVDRARYERRLRQAVDANVNLVRVWGGGIYESDDFYELCDRLGLLTWQDFLFACAAYPEEEPLRSEVEAEARENIERLSSHASLVLFTGNNENIWGYEDWGWKTRLDGKTWGAYYYYELFPRLIAELAPHVPYAPGSPFSPGAGWDGEKQFGPHPNDEHHGSVHLWEQWNRQDWLTYRDHSPRFVAEFGWQGPPTWSTLTRWLDDDPLTPESTGMIVHQKAMEGNVKLENGLLPHFRVPADMETWHWAMQLNQAIAVRAALEHFRALAPHTMGAVVWQLNDCWPVTSWSAIDGDERPKPLFYALRNAFAPRAVTVQPRDGRLVAVLSNDTSDDWSGEVRSTRRSVDGQVCAEASVRVSVPAWGSRSVELDVGVATSTDAGGEFAVVEMGAERAVWFFAEPRSSAWPKTDIAVDVVDAAGGVEVTLMARALAVDVALLVDKIAPHAIAAEGMFTLLPGESRTVHVSGLTVADAAALADPRVLRTANQLVAEEAVRR